MRSEANGLTASAKFNHIHCVDDYLFEVRAGIDVGQATRKAACLAESIEDIATQAVQDGMSSELAYLVAFAADAIWALMTSVEGAYAGNKKATA